MKRAISFLFVFVFSVLFSTPLGFGMVALTFIVLGEGAKVWANNYVPVVLDLPVGTIWARAHGINDLGQVVGQAAGPGVHLAILWNGTTPTVLQVPDGMTGAGAWAINNKGQIAGDTGSPLWGSFRYVGTEQHPYC